MTNGSGEIVFWVLRQKFVDSETAAPEQSSQVFYYSLAIGHHVGVIDCLNVALRCPQTEYEAWISQLTDEQARRKMLGVLTFGEIVIDVSHAALLGKAFAPLGNDATSPWNSFSNKLLHHLDEMKREPAIYLMAKKIV